MNLFSVNKLILILEKLWDKNYNLNYNKTD